MMTRKLNCVIESLCAILGFEPIVSTNWIFDVEYYEDEDYDENDELDSFSNRGFLHASICIRHFSQPITFTIELGSLSIYCCNKEEFWTMRLLLKRVLYVNMWISNDNGIHKVFFQLFALSSKLLRSSWSKNNSTFPMILQLPLTKSKMRFCLLWTHYIHRAICHGRKGFHDTFNSQFTRTHKRLDTLDQNKFNKQM